MESRKRALLAITGAFALSGGIAASTRLVIWTLLDAGYQLDIIALNENAQAYPSYENFKGVEYWAANQSKVRFVSRVYRAALSQRYMFVFSDHINVASMLAPLALMRIIRYAVRIHLIEALPPLVDVQGRIGMRFAWKLQASAFGKREVLKFFPDMKIDVVPLSLEPDVGFDLTAEPTTLEFKAVDGKTHSLGDQVVLQVGRMAAGEQYKGQDVLIQAMPSCPTAQLVLVGKGDDMPRLRTLAQAQSPKVQTRIFMPGYVSDDDLERLYQQCSMFAMPSRGEGFGVVYLEAMRWGKPCIASRVDAAQFIVEDGVTGILVSDPTDPQVVAKAILELLTDTEKAHRYGKAGYERVKTQYTFEQFRQHFLDSLSLKES